MIGNICPVCGAEIDIFKGDFKRHVKDHWEKDDLDLSLPDYVRYIYSNPPYKSKEVEDE